MRPSTKIVLSGWAVLVAMAFLWVPWTAPGPERLLDLPLPTSEVFMGYGWFWQGPEPKPAFDFVSATRHHWGVQEELSAQDIEQLRATLPSLVNDPKSNREKILLVEQMLPVLAPAGDAPRPSEVPAEMMKAVDERGLQPVFLTIADEPQVTTWLKVKRNFDRTFPDKQNLTQNQQLKLLGEWETHRYRQQFKRYARVKYPYIGLELLSLTLLAGVPLVLLYSRKH